MTMPRNVSLYVVPTPIGNLEDITYRALRVLGEADLILAEDTRTSSKLLMHYKIQNSVQSFHIHNEHRVLERYVEQMKEGKTIALVSDAGTPAISDPGFLLVRECIKEGLEVECLPGATAFVPALVNSGFPLHNFVYEGFLPHKKGRKTSIERIAAETRTVVLYESPHRLLKLLKELDENLEDSRQVCVCRELSKLHEESARGTAGELFSYFDEKGVKGEIVVVVSGKE